MATKKKGVLTTSGEWAKHLRKFKKRKFWKAERKEGKKTYQSNIGSPANENTLPYTHQNKFNSDFIVNQFDVKEWNW